MHEGLKKALIIVPVLAGIGLLFMLVKNRAEPEQAPLTEQARTVRVLAAPTTSVVPRVLGYGNVEPDKVWEAVAEVSGKILEIHPRLKKGAILEQGSVILKIDPVDYRLAIAETESSIQSAQAQLAQMEVEETNTRASLKIEQQALELGRTELARKRKLAAQGTLPRSDLDQEQRNVLAQEQSVQALKNTLNLYPVERKRLQAELARSQTQLETAKLNLERTTITLPFTGRVAQVEVEQTQYSRQGDVLVVVDGIDRARIPVQIPMTRLRGLMQAGKPLDLAEALVKPIGQVIGLSAQVRLRLGEQTLVWPGQVARFSDTLDTTTRTVGVIVEVDKPYTDVQPGTRPPLIKGLFVEVELQGRPRPDSLIIPRAALHEDWIYIVNAENRLEKRPVKVDLVQPDFVTLKQGVEAGEQVVLSDLVPAIEGMLLKPVPDEASLTRLLQQAEGEDR